MVVAQEDMCSQKANQCKIAQLEVEVIAAKFTGNLVRIIWNLLMSKI
jgi:hypothetical protein